MGAIRLYGDTSGYLELQAPAVAPSSALTIPAGGFGKVLQVVRGTHSTDSTTTSTAFVDLGPSVTITPQESTSNLILIAAFGAGTSSGSLNTHGADYQITDSSNATVSGAERSIFQTEGYSGSGNRAMLSGVVLYGYVATPGTSALTYKLRARARLSGGTTVVFGAQQTSQMYAIEVAA